MNPDDVRKAVLAQLRRIAPELEEGDLAPSKPLRAQVDLDSMDWLNFLVALHDHFKVEIPEADYAKLGTLDQVVTYLCGALGCQPSNSSSTAKPMT